MTYPLLHVGVTARFLVLIVGFAVLTFISNRMSGNPIGTFAGWVEAHASPNQGAM